ncbi:MAG: dihydroorotase [Chloroflexi bacterium]|nr:dihydroorotase [Chloroflexota bacterium]
MYELIVKNGRIIDPSQDMDVVGDLLIREGKIESIVPGGLNDARADCEARPSLDASGSIVCPGFIDLHTHLREPGYEEKETIATGTLAAAIGGFTTVCCMPNTNPAIDTLATIDHVRRAAEAMASIRVLPIAAITKKREGKELTEMGELARAGAIAFSDDGRPVPNSRIMRYALEYSRMHGRPIISHCEDIELAKDGVMNESVVAVKLGLKGIPAAAEDIIVAREIALLEAFGGRLHIAHVSSTGAVEMIRRAKEKGLALTAEATPHHLTLTEDWVAGQRGNWGLEFPYLGAMAPYNTDTKVNPPLRAAADARALIQGLVDGTIDAVATDHAPHTIVDKQCEYDQAEFGISGLETALASLMILVHRGEIDANLLVRKLTIGPARVMDLPFGTFKKGAPADVAIFNPDEEWTVEPGRFASKGKNTPLAGMRLRGKVVCTIVAGKVVYGERARGGMATRLETGQAVNVQ